MQRTIYKLLFAVLLTGLSLPVLADNHHASQDDVLMPRFKFQAQSNSDALSGADGLAAEQSNLAKPVLRPFGQFRSMEQYDATVYFPLNELGFNLDLGVNLRHLDARYSQNSLEGGLSATIPTLYAEALFNLPFKGLSASVGGHHIDWDQTQVFDYQAKLSYRWQNGFGLAGGWQHQQFSLDKGSNSTFREEGVFLDFDYKF